MPGYKFSLIAVGMISISCNAAPITHRWVDSGGENLTSIDISHHVNGKNVLLNVFYSVNGEKKLKVEDYITDCELDSVLEINNKSIQVLELHNKSYKAFLFSYRIGCVGGVDSVIPPQNQLIFK